MPKFSKFFNALKGLLTSKQSRRKISKLAENNKDNKPTAFKDLVNFDLVNSEKPKKVDRGLKRFITDVFINLEQQMRSLYWLQRMKHVFIISAPVPSSYNKYAGLARKEQLIDSIDRRLSKQRMRSTPAKAEVINRKLNSRLKSQRISYKQRMESLKNPYRKKGSLSANELPTSRPRKRLTFTEMLALQIDTGRTR